MPVTAPAYPGTGRSRERLSHGVAVSVPAQVRPNACAARKPIKVPPRPGECATSSSERQNDLWFATCSNPCANAGMRVMISSSVVLSQLRAGAGQPTPPHPASSAWGSRGTAGSPVRGRPSPLAPLGYTSGTPWPVPWFLLRCARPGCRRRRAMQRLSSEPAGDQDRADVPKLLRVHVWRPPASESAGSRMASDDLDPDHTSPRRNCCAIEQGRMLRRRRICHRTGRADPLLDDSSLSFGRGRCPHSDRSGHLRRRAGARQHYQARTLR
jgi:hypothetical protein